MKFLPSNFDRNATFFAGAAWLLCAISGLAWMWNYENTPGATSAAPSIWPVETALPRMPGMWSLLLFMHPRCPCSHATLVELKAILASAKTQVRTRVLFYHPAGTAESWARTALWLRAAAIPGVSVVADEEGAEARHFHATTSGVALLYDAEGRCTFSGGITASRGHPGMSAGSASLGSLLRREVPDHNSARVFGCGLVKQRSLPEDAGSSSPALP